MAERHFFVSSRRRHTRFSRDWSSDVCSSDLDRATVLTPDPAARASRALAAAEAHDLAGDPDEALRLLAATQAAPLTGAQAARVRSEERRVGKEGASTWRQYREEK